MGLGGDWSSAPYGLAEIDEAEAAVEAALEAGITIFDQAAAYRFGKSEAVFGEVLSRWEGLRERIQINTHCGFGDEAGEARHYDLDGASIIESVRRSLTRLKTDYIDTLLLNRADPLLEPGQIASAFEFLRSSGKVRHLGVSNMSGAQIAALQKHLDTPIVLNQMEMSLGKRDWIEAGVLVNHPDGNKYSFPEGTIEYCLGNAVRLQAWAPLARGVYSGRVSAAKTPEEATTKLVLSLADRKDTTPEAIVLAWLMKHPAGIEPVIGTRNPQRILASRDAEFQATRMTRHEWYALWRAARGADLPFPGPGTEPESPIPQARALAGNSAGNICEL
ncbi:aldo/keto reductase [Arthrobacter sp. CDRTa11]|nr:aldo/keto reductase [Arthrobacter sp. CDRTa11]